MQDASKTWEKKSPAAKEFSDKAVQMLQRASKLLLPGQFYWPTDPRPPVEYIAFEQELSVGVQKTVPLVNHAFVPLPKEGVLTKMAKMTNLHSKQ